MIPGPDVSTKAALERRLLAEMRLLGADIMKMEQAVADAQGVNTTDLHCLEILSRLGPLAASDLAAESGLSRAAVTTVIDRLEGGGWARRVDDAKDRRRVIVQLTEKAAERGPELFGDLVRASLQLHKRYSNHELELLLDFIAQTRALLSAHAERSRSPAPEAPDEK